MKNTTNHLIKPNIPVMFNFSAVAALLLVLFMINTGCQKNASAPSPTSDQSSSELKLSQTNDWTEVNLVSDVDEYSPIFIDPNLVNAWGLAISDEGEVWVSAADAGVATIYDGNGQMLEPAITIPGGAPTGAIYNSTESFIIPSTNEKAEFIYATENGTIVGAASGVAHTVADRSAEDAVYKGLTFAKINGQAYLYATDFHNAKVDVYDGTFTYISTMSFVDPGMPAGYAPFNIRNFGTQIFVTYAKQLAPDNEDDEKGPGNGFVDIYTTNGTFVQRFISHGELNSPWGMEKVSGPGGGMLIGNFGNGKINTYDMSGNFVKALKSGGEPLKIEGLWSILSPGQNLPESFRHRIYFTAGPDEESHGVFGYITQN
jgi:uncharacterized protein (TIGR03118 family)